MLSALTSAGRRPCANGESRDLSKVRIDDWAGGYFGDPKESGFRFRRAISYYAGDPAASTFAAGPIEGVVVFVNLNTKKVFRFIDSGVVSPPQGAIRPGYARQIAIPGML